MTGPKVELVKPILGSDGPRGIRAGDRFDRGERIILVDGERWGRTHVTWHGVHGTVTTFAQHGGEIVQEQYGNSDHWHDVRISSPKKRHAKRWIGHELRLPEGFKDTDELVLEKASELVSKGQLRSPAVVKRERDELHARFEANRKEADRIEAETFRAKAVEATGANDPNAEIVERVLAAMRWAQSQ